MIKVTVKKDNIKITGHAMYDEYGKDIVCAAVSSIVITTVNGIMKLDDSLINTDDTNGKVEIKILKHTKECDILINNMLDLLEELKEQYKNNIKIIK
jgi:uncharacterized protein YsxB (DUF464 family)